MIKIGVIWITDSTQEGKYSQLWLLVKSIGTEEKLL